jgi:hypothetical protein
MTHVYFDCSTPEGLVFDRLGSDVEDLIEARERAARIILTCIAKPGPEDWRRWTVRVSDEDGEELFAMPFAAMLGARH